jgi:hypothetical protein
MYKILIGKRKAKRPLGKPRRRRKLIVQWILEKSDAKVRTECIWLGSSGGPL